MSVVLLLLVLLLASAWPAEAQLNAATGSFNVTTAAAGNTVVVTGLGFQPKIVFFFWSGRTESVDTISRINQQHGFGAAISTTERFAVVARSNDASALAAAASAHSDAACILGTTATPTIGAAMDLQSMDSGGFTLVIDDDFGNDLRVTYVALGGPTLTGQKIGTFTPTGTAPVTQAVTGVGFQPEVVIFAAIAAAAAAPPSAVLDSTLMLGAITGATGEGVWVASSDDAAATMQTMAYALSGEAIARFDNTITAIADRAEFSAFGADGFTINWLERANAGTVFYVALDGLNATVGNFVTQTDTTTAITTGALGYTPRAMVVVSAARAASTADTPTDHDQLSIGAAVSASARSAQATLDEDAVLTSEVTVAIEFDAVYANISTASAIQGLMDVTAFNNDDVAFIMDDADPSASFAWWIAFGEPTVTSSGQRMSLLGVGDRQ